MGTRSESKKARLATYLTETQAERIDESVWQALQQRLAPVSDGYLRKLVRASGRPMVPLIEGVVQDSFDDLARTLTALQAEYESNAERRREIRKLVITAKDHAFFALKRMPPDDERRESKEEMLLWMRTWLENPSVFSTWLTLRRAQAATPASHLHPPHQD